jgi:hypothetical protein
MKFQKDAINDLCPNFYSPKERVTLLWPEDRRKIVTN